MAEIQLSQPKTDEAKQQRYTIFRNQWLNENVYPGCNEITTDQVKQALCLFFPGALGFTDEMYFGLPEKEQWTFSDFDIILQLLTATSPDRLKMSFDEYKTYRANIMEIAQRFTSARTDAEPGIRADFEAMESVVAMTGGEA